MNIYLLKKTFTCQVAYIYLDTPWNWRKNNHEQTLTTKTNLKTPHLNHLVNRKGGNNEQKLRI